MKIIISDFERHQFAATGEGFVGDTGHGPLAIGSNSSPALSINFLMSFQFKGCAWSWRAEVSHPIFFNPNRTASLEQGLCRWAAVWTREIVAT